MKLRLTWSAVAWSLLAALAISVACVGLVGWHQGYRLYAVRTGSMTPTYPTGSLLLDAPARPGLPRVGQVITFRTSDGLVTHRVHELTPAGIKTKGDANESPDPWTLPQRNVEGAVVGGIPYGGYLLVFLQQPTGVPSLMVLTLSIVLAWTVFFGEPSAPRAARYAPAHARPARLSVAR
ncbi:MAG: signal peptidase I [Angustibacter sp.]